MGQKHPVFFFKLLKPWPFIVSFPLKMVIFHSYVKLPEGKREDIGMINSWRGYGQTIYAAVSLLI